MRARVLVADSNEFTARQAAFMLRRLGCHDVRGVHDDEAARRVLEKGRFDLLLVDDGLRSAGGVGLTRWLRAAKTNPNRAAPVILVLGAPTRAQVEQARDGGATEILRKPFSVGELGVHLKSALQRPRRFVVSESYVGPDRRRIARGDVATERRQRVEIDA